jgi:hypothetical protein
MPIRPENKLRYPPHWKDIRAKILERAGHKCEGSSAYPDCRAVNYEPHPVTGSKVVLTIGHLKEPVEDCSDENLKAWCQRCHLTYDALSHAESRKKRKTNPV